MPDTPDFVRIDAAIIPKVGATDATEYNSDNCIRWLDNYRIRTLANSGLYAVLYKVLLS